jgi:hypothetical protein
LTRGRAAAAAIAIGMAFSCNDPVLTGRLDTVPPVHRVPPDVVGTVILITEDAEIETHDPEHIARAKRIHVPEDYRGWMQNALRLAGFEITANPGQRHDLVGKLALAVSEEGRHVRQTYRCYLRAPDGKEVALIDWTWPEDTRVDGAEVYEFATHHLATEVATSHVVLDWLHTHRIAAPSSPDAG